MLHPMNSPGRCLATALASVSLVASLFPAAAQDTSKPPPNANRLTHLDETDPFHPNLSAPRLTTPQWIGEDGVEAVVILAIDDLRETEKYEKFLRPILERLKKIDGRAPVSILINAVTTTDPRLQAWLAEGLSLEVHTLAHPCPCLAKGDFNAASNTYHGGVELLNQIPGNHPVAFRMPCCDSMNSPSPRFYAEIFNRGNEAGQFLTLDSSVMNLPTPADPSLPRGLVLDAAGRERFRKYFPTVTNAVTKVSLEHFGTVIENHPYPYVIGKMCWEFPATVPSDWEAFNVHGSTNATTLADWKAALDITVLKQGVFTFIFHPHGWSSPEQFVEFIDYAVSQHGRKVKFLNFREAQDRLNANLLAGQPLRTPDGQDNGVRLLDLNNDGYLDVVLGGTTSPRTRVWEPQRRTWTETPFPTPVTGPGSDGKTRVETGVRFGIVSADGFATALLRNETVAGAWHYDGRQWVAEPTLLAGLELQGKPILTSAGGHDRGVRLRDVDRDGRCEILVGNDTQNGVLAWSPEEKAWKRLPYALPEGTAIVDAEGRDAGLRFVDLNDDGYEDAVFSNDNRFSVHIYIATPKPWLGWERGWTFRVAGGPHGIPGDLPPIVSTGAHPNNGAWFHDRQMWWQNEGTDRLPDKVERRTFTQLLTGEESPPKSPADSLAAIRVRAGFKVELVASEPLVMDPVAFEWGADGRLWVVEMRDYPLGLDGKGKPGGVVKYLEDTDGDGTYDKATVFLEGLNFPTGIMPWRNGVLISAAPDILYAGDTDGDGKADLRKTILSGFGEGNQQHRINGFEYGLDNWVYAGNGGSNGDLRSVATGTTAKLRGHDLRFRPDDGRFELVAGQAQFGRRRDDWGNWFANANPTWLWHYLLPEHYLLRNPQLAVATTRETLANYANPTRVFPISRPQQRFNWPDAANNLTSANSPTPYRDDLFGPQFAHAVFISEPAQNVVHLELLEENGVTFTSHRAGDEQDREFLASGDNWFRPTMLKTGPDGALYIADMYRLVIEHPEYFPEELKGRPDLRFGEDKGRIYRVFPTNAPVRRILRLDRLDPAGLVAAMDSANGWQRDTAQRLLVQAGRPGPVAALEKLATLSSNPKSRLQALCTLDGLAALTPTLLIAALHDSHPAVREHALRLGETTLPGSGPLQEAVLALVRDPALRVRYQLAFTLGEWGDPRAARALATLAENDRADAHLSTAVLSSSTPHADSMIPFLLRPDAPAPPPVPVLAPLLALVAGPGHEAVLRQALDRIAQPVDGRLATWQLAAFAGFLDALERRQGGVDTLYKDAGGTLRATFPAMDALFRQARQTALDGAGGEPDRLTAIQLLGRGRNEVDADLDRLGSLLQPQEKGTLQQAALNGLKRSSSPKVGAVLLAHWKSYGPAFRVEVLNILVTRPEWMRPLLGAIEAGQIAPGEISPLHQEKLRVHPDQPIRERARKAFATRDADRQKVVTRFAGVNELLGDANRGAPLYRQNCLPCHRLKGEGNTLGPDLGTMSDKPIGTLLVAILDPNQAFETRYVNFTATTRDGRELSGIIAAETPNSITLRNAGGIDEVVLRGELKDLASSGRSIMPEGFENTFTPQALGDLIAYIRAR